MDTKETEETVTVKFIVNFASSEEFSISIGFILKKHYNNFCCFQTLMNAMTTLDARQIRVV